MLERFLMRNRGLRAKRAIPRDDIRTLITALKSNEPVWYAPDQSYRKKGAEMVQFFHLPAATNTATSRLARMTGAAVLPYFPERLPGSRGYRMVIQPMLENFPTRRSGCRRATLQRADRSAGAARTVAVPVDPSAVQRTDARLSGLLRAALAATRLWSEEFSPRRADLAILASCMVPAALEYALQRRGEGTLWRPSGR